MRNWLLVVLRCKHGAKAPPGATPLGVGSAKPSDLGGPGLGAGEGRLPTT